MKIIKEISSKAPHSVLHLVLRKGKSTKSCFFDDDNLAIIHCFELYIDKSLIGIISLFSKYNSIFAVQNQSYIRDIAVLEVNQKKVWVKV